MKDLLHFMLASIVEKVDSISIEEKEDDGFIEFVISVDPSDMGKVIGKNGKVIRAIRNVVKILAMKEQKRIKISLAEQE